MNAGNFQNGDKIKIRLNVTGNELALYQGYFYEENQNALEEWYSKASEEIGELEKISSSHLTGKIELKESDYLVFSIPYEKDWVIKIDDKRVKQEEVLDALMAVKLSAGNHTIDMYYLSAGFIIGMNITLLSLLILISMFVYSHYRKR